MPKRRSSRKPTATYKTTQHELATPLRRSKRILHQKPHDLNTGNSIPSNSHRDNTQKASKELRESDGRSSIRANPILGLRRSPRFSKRVEGVSNARRSVRLSLLGNTNAIQEKSQQDKSKKSCDSKSNKLRHSASSKLTDSKSNKKSIDRVLNKSIEKGEVCVGSCDEIVRRSERGTQDCAKVEVVIGLEAAKGKIIPERSKESRVVRKRKRGEEGNYGSVNGWTKEQEVALQRAYFTAKPTPHFWKKVSKLVFMLLFGSFPSLLLKQ